MDELELDVIADEQGEQEIDTSVLPFASPRPRSTSPPPDTPVVQSPAFPRSATPARKSDHQQCQSFVDPTTLAIPLIIGTAKTTFAKSSLSKALILGQVDRKYIACLLGSSSSMEGQDLVLIDQHAADERVSVEAILRELCDGFAKDNVDIMNSTQVEPEVLLNREEAEVLANPAVLDIFRRWGIQLALPDILASDYVQVSVEAVPKSLASRLGRKDAIEMTRLIKLYLPVLDSCLGEMKALIAEATVNEVDWGRVLRWMPKEMLELANSKACRGTRLPFPLARS